MSILLAIDNATIQKWSNVAMIVGGIIVVIALGMMLLNRNKNKQK